MLHHFCLHVPFSWGRWRVPVNLEEGKSGLIRPHDFFPLLQTQRFQLDSHWSLFFWLDALISGFLKVAQLSQFPSVPFALCGWKCSYLYLDLTKSVWLWPVEHRMSKISVKDFSQNLSNLFTIEFIQKCIHHRAFEPQNWTDADYFITDTIQIRSLAQPSKNSATENWIATAILYQRQVWHRQKLSGKLNVSLTMSKSRSTKEVSFDLFGWVISECPWLVWTHTDLWKWAWKIGRCATEFKFIG